MIFIKSQHKYILIILSSTFFGSSKKVAKKEAPAVLRPSLSKNFKINEK